MYEPTLRENAGALGRDVPWAVAQLSAQVVHGWIATMPGITMPVHQLPLVVFAAVDLGDAEVDRLDRAAADGCCAVFIADHTRQGRR